MKKSLLVGFFVLISTVFLCMPAFAGEIVIISNPTAPDSSVDKEWVKNVYLGNITKWSNNDPIVLSIITDETTHSNFLKEYIQRNPSQFLAFWKNMMFTGKGNMPQKEASKEEMINFVANTKGAIGYMPSGTKSDKIKIINSN